MCHVLPVHTYCRPIAGQKLSCQLAAAIQVTNSNNNNWQQQSANTDTNTNASFCFASLTLWLFTLISVFFPHFFFVWVLFFVGFLVCATISWALEDDLCYELGLRLGLRLGLGLWLQLCCEVETASDTRPAGVATGRRLHCFGFLGFFWLDPTRLLACSTRLWLNFRSCICRQLKTIAKVPRPGEHCYMTMAIVVAVASLHYFWLRLAWYQLLLISISTSIEWASGMTVNCSYVLVMRKASGNAYSVGSPLPSRSPLNTPLLSALASASAAASALASMAKLCSINYIYMCMCVLSRVWPEFVFNLIETCAPKHVGSRNCV